MAFEIIKQGASVLGIGVILMGVGGYGSIQLLPTTTVVATVTNPDASVLPPRLNLNLVVKCFADPTKMCFSDMVEFGFPGLSVPDVAVAEDYLGSIRKEFNSPQRDPKGRNQYAIKVVRPLRGGDTILVNVEINAMVTPADLRFSTITDPNVFAKKFNCQPEQVPALAVSRVTCNEKFTWRERLVLLLPFVR